MTARNSTKVTNQNKGNKKAEWKRETTFLQNVILNHNWAFCQELAKWSARAFVAETIPGAHEYLNWWTEPEFGTRVVRVIISQTCDSWLRHEVSGGIKIAENDKLYVDFVNLIANQEICDVAGVAGKDSQILAAIDKVQP